MAYTSLPTVVAGEPSRASWANLVDSNLDDHQTRLVAAEGAIGTVNNTVDVTLAGTPTYLTIVGQVITRALINLTSHVTGRLPFANLTAATAANRLLGRGSSGGAGDLQEIALGAGLSMSGSTLTASIAAGAVALDDLSDVIITTPATNDVLQYTGAGFVNQPAANINASSLSTGTVAAGRMPALTGDVTTSAGAVATTIANDAVTYAKLQNVSAASKLLGRGSAAGAGDAQELTVGTGLSMSGTTLSATGTGTGDVSGPASAVDAELVLFDSTTGKLVKRATGTGFVRAASGVATVAKLKRVVGAVIGDGTNVIATGVQGFVSCPVAGTITKVRLLSSDAALTSGSIVVDVWKDTYANYPPTVADTITASAKPTISSATKSEDATLTGWTTSVAAGDVFGFNVDSVTSLKRVTLEITVDE